MSRMIWSRERPERDRHVRRTGDDYCRAFLGLLPQGQAWLGVQEPGSILWRVCCGLAQYWGFIDGRAADLLERESDPRKTIELLPDWERAWGLPDPCFPDATTIGERQKMLITKMTWMGGQSREYFERIMKWLGFEIHIKEFAPVMAGVSRAGETRENPDVIYKWNKKDAAGGIHCWIGGDISTKIDGTWEPCPNPDFDAVKGVDNFRWYTGPPEMRFAWSANAGKMGLVWFRAASGEAGVDHHLQFRQPQDLQCLLNRWMPAHTSLVMDFSELAFSGPMEGTP